MIMDFFDCELSLEKYKNIINNCNDINIRDRYGKTALFYTHVEHSKLLISVGININALDNNGQNALFSVNELKNDANYDIAQYGASFQKAKLLIDSLFLFVIKICIVIRV